MVLWSETVRSGLALQGLVLRPDSDSLRFVTTQSQHRRECRRGLTSNERSTCRTLPERRLSDHECGRCRVVFPPSQAQAAPSSNRTGAMAEHDGLGSTRKMPHIPPSVKTRRLSP